MPRTLQHLTEDVRLLFATRFIRLFAYGALSVVLVFYLVGLGLSESQTGLLLTCNRASPRTGSTCDSVHPGTFGTIFFRANIFAGLSALVASRLADRIGLIRTMVVAHLPSNVQLIPVPMMPTLSLAVLVLLVRFSISQMDVPTRRSYVMAIVSPDERSAAAGITGVARTMGAAVSPLFARLLFAQPSLLNAPFYIAGVLKIAYDLLLYQQFVAIKA
jgi:sugar phosphate permease